MKITRNTVVEFHFTLKTEKGDMIMSSPPDTPERILHGRGSVIRGLDNALSGREDGDSFEITVNPEEGYGLRQEGWQARLSKKHFSPSDHLISGAEVTVNIPSGPRQVTVRKVGAKMVDVDMNHPLAGKSLHFSIEILRVREATMEEISHGHAHDPDEDTH